MNKQFYRFSFNCKYDNINDFINDKSYYNFIMKTDWIKSCRHINTYNYIKSFKEKLDEDNKVKVIKTIKINKLPKFNSEMFEVKPSYTLNESIKSPTFTFGKYKDFQTTHNYYDVTENNEYLKFVHYTRQSYKYENEDEVEREDFLTWLNDNVTRYNNITNLCSCKYCKYVQYIYNKRKNETKRNYIDDFIKKYMQYILKQFTIYYYLKKIKFNAFIKSIDYFSMYNNDPYDKNIPHEYRYCFMKIRHSRIVLDLIEKKLIIEEEIKENKKINYNNIHEELMMVCNHPSIIQKHLSFYEDEEEAFNHL
jgi:hypothetical protein